MEQTTIDINDYTSLLKRVELTRWKYDELLRQSVHEFNVFSLLRNEDDEVYLHSRFLFELLNPQGSHAQGSTFLELFLGQVGISGFELENVYAKKEYQNIDVFVANDTQAVIIENKVYAEDQKRQLQRYYQIARREGFTDIWIIYLTLDGHEPSDYSLGTLKESADDLVTLISYQNDINSWLEKCIHQVSLVPVLRETIVQYQRLVQKLTGQSMLKGYIMDIKDLLIDERNIELAGHISQALIEAKSEIQFRFWQELEKALAQKGYQSIDGGKYSREWTERYYKLRTNNRYFGLKYKLYDLNDTDILYFKIQVGWDLVYGFMVNRGEKIGICKEAQFDQLVEIIQGIDQKFERSEWWLGWKMPTRELNFDAFNSANVFALADPAKRSEYVNELADEIVANIDRFKELYEQRIAAKS